MGYQNMGDCTPLPFWNKSVQVEQPQILPRIDSYLDSLILNKKYVIKSWLILTSACRLIRMTSG